MTDPTPASENDNDVPPRSVRGFAGDDSTAQTSPRAEGGASAGPASEAGSAVYVRRLLAEAAGNAHASCCRDGSPCLLVGRLADALEAASKALSAASAERDRANKALDAVRKYAKRERDDLAYLEAENERGGLTELGDHSRYTLKRQLNDLDHALALAEPAPTAAQGGEADGT